MPDELLPAFSVDPSATLASHEATIQDFLKRIATAEASAVKTIAVLNWRVGLCFRVALQAEKWKQLNDASLALAKQNREMQGSWWDRFLGDMGKLATGAIVGGVIAAMIAL